MAETQKPECNSNRIARKSPVPENRQKAIPMISMTANSKSCESTLAVLLLSFFFVLFFFIYSLLLIIDMFQPLVIAVSTIQKLFSISFCCYYPGYYGKVYKSGCISNQILVPFMLHFLLKSSEIVNKCGITNNISKCYTTHLTALDK